MAEGALFELLSFDRSRRLAALRRAQGGEAAAFRLRSALLFDPDGELRACAAERLGLLGLVGAAPWLREATDDALPSVRLAAFVALARLRDEEAIPLAERALLRDEAWWVRRGALVALITIAGTEGAAAIEGALSDPFWRVRWVAYQCLASLGAQASIVGPARASGAFSGGWFDDPDPAVLHARLRAQGDEPCDPSLLVGWLASPHEPLRRLATRRLALLGSSDDLALTLRLLEDPRAPYAPEAAREALSRARASSDLCARVLSLGGHPTAVAWALDLCAARGLDSLLPQAHRRLTSSSGAVRAAALRAVAALDEEATPTLLAALDDPEGEARGAALGALLARGGLPDRFPWERCPPGLWAALADDAGHHRDLAWLRQASAGAPALLRARALAWRSRLGDLAEHERHALLVDPDPWMRVAALGAPEALTLVLIDPDPEVRRVALAILIERRSEVPPSLLGATALGLARAPDPGLRAECCALLDAADPGHLAALLRLARDPELQVRSAAFGRLEPREDLPARLDALLASPGVDQEDIASAYLWKTHACPGETIDLLLRGLGELEGEGPARARLLAALAALPREGVEGRAGASQALREALGPPPTPAAPAALREATEANLPGPAGRPLGRSGVVLPALVVSGVNEPPRRELRRAFEAGATAFFWEPSHRGSISVLRELGERASVVSGSFEADPSRVELDLERALRRLRRGFVDVFLLYWARSRARLSEETLACLERQRSLGKIKVFGFSTHDRDLGVWALGRGWPALMTRHNAAHPGAERVLFPEAAARGAGVLSFSALCYGRMLRPLPGYSSPPSAADCYRYSLRQPGVTSCVAAPRSGDDLDEALSVIERPDLDENLVDALRAHGAAVMREEQKIHAPLRRGDLISLATEPAPEDWSAPCEPRLARGQARRAAG